MKRALKIILAAVGTVTALCAVLLLSAEAILNSPKIKSQLEGAIAEKLKVNVRVRERIDLSFLPYFTLAAGDVHVSIKGNEIISAEKVEIGLRLVELFFKNVNIEKLEIAGMDAGRIVKRYVPDVSVTGNVNVAAVISAEDIHLKGLLESLKEMQNKEMDFYRAELPFKTLTFDKLSIFGKDMALSKGGIAADGAALELISDTLLVAAEHRLLVKDCAGLLNAAALTGRVSIKRLAVPSHKIENIRASFSGDKGVFMVDPAELQYFGTQTNITSIINMNEDVPRMKVKAEMPGLSLERYLELAEEKIMFKGVLKVAAEIESSGKTIHEMMNHVQGTFSVKGRNVELNGLDINKVLDAFEKTKGYDIEDLAALVTLGPAGPLVTKGYDAFAALQKIKGATGDSVIQQVVSEWGIDNGTAAASDVAFTTERHRAAIRGDLDLVNKRFKNLTVAVVDHEGCIINSETIDGPFDNPEIQAKGVVERLVIRPLSRSLQSGCAVFYEGTLRHPDIETK